MRAIGEDVRLGSGTVVVAPRIVLEDGVTIADGGSVRCDEVFAAGALAAFGPRLELACRRAFVGAGLWAGRGIRIGGGGHRDPWATFVIGDLGFIGDEAFVNVGRPVLIGREAFVTMRSVLLTHNVGHSLLEGSRTASPASCSRTGRRSASGRSSYAGCRVGRESIVASNSYVVSDIPAGSLAVGVPARVSRARRAGPLSRPRQVAAARQIVDELARAAGAPRRRDRAARRSTAPTGSR